MGTTVCISCKLNPAFQAIFQHSKLYGQAFTVDAGKATGVWASDRTQCVSVKGVMSEMNRLIYGVPQGSVLRPVEICIYTLPLSAILKHYKIDYHIYGDDTQIYCSFDAESLDEVLGSLDNCISDIRSWMITNKLKINDSKTEFLLITSPRSKFTKDIQITIGQSNIRSIFHM